MWLIDLNSHHKRLQVFEIVTFVHYILKVIKKNLDTVHSTNNKRVPVYYEHFKTQVINLEENCYH